MFRSFLQKLRPIPNVSYTVRNLRRMIDHRVIPDALPTLPQVILDVKYGEVKVDMGNILTPTIVGDEPKVSWKFEAKTFYTLILIDPDAPSRISPLLRTWHHWLVGNIQENNLEHADVLSEYIGPIPARRTGLHRYVFAVYKQPGKIQFTEKKLNNKTMDGRSMFSIKKFTQKYKLGTALAGNFFQAEWDGSVPKRRRRLSRFNIILSRFLK